MRFDLRLLFFTHQTMMSLDPFYERMNFDVEQLILKLILLLLYSHWFVTRASLVQDFAYRHGTLKFLWEYSLTTFFFRPSPSAANFLWIGPLIEQSQ